MNVKDITESTNPILAGSLPALQRAAKRAKKIAEQTGTRLIVATKQRGAAKPKVRGIRVR